MKNVFQTPIRLLALCAALLLATGQNFAQTPCIDSSLIVPGGACITLWDPVCGCDGKTYGNSCEAKIWHGVTSWNQGVCPGFLECNDLTTNFFWSLTPADPRYVQFQDQSAFPNGQITSWLWDFGDGKTSAEQNPTHAYTDFGPRNVCLTVKATAPNGQICEAKRCNNVRVEECQKDCDWMVDYVLNGAKLNASLTVNTPNMLPLQSVRWTLGGGSGPAVTGEDRHFSHLFGQPGRYVLCARYAQFDGSVCTECKVLEVTEPCVDPALIDPNAACPLVFAPVCGCDGKTYDNACVAEKKAGITAWQPGACGSVCNGLSADFEGFNSGGSLTVYTFNGKATLPQGTTATGWFWDFGNGQTSTLQSPTLNFFTLGDYDICLTVTASVGSISCATTVCKTFHIGELCFDQSLIDPNAVCPAVYDPVCGCDGQTYENACIAEKKYGLTDWTPGRCASACFDPAQVDTTQFCTADYDPVCGCDGYSYGNSCDAFLLGITGWRAGRCCPDGTCKALFNVQVLPDRRVLLSDVSVQAESWQLEFGDGSTHGGFFDSLVHTYATTGLYQICLSISNFAGSCSDKYCRVIDLSKVAAGEPGERIGLTVLPNPASEQAWVLVLGATPRRAALWDVLGKNVWQQAVSAQGFEVPLGHLPPGVYLLRVETDEGWAVKKLVVGAH